MTPRWPWLLLALVGCGQPVIVDVDKSELDDYQDWYRVDVTGEVGGHGDSYRIVFANPEALSRTDGAWNTGTIIVKEIRDRDGDGPGDLRYIGIMRLLDNGDTPDGAELHNIIKEKSDGWLFTYLDVDIDSDEEYRESCWNDCHVASPYAGAFLDYTD